MPDSRRGIALRDRLGLVGLEACFNLFCNSGLESWVGVQSNTRWGHGRSHNARYADAAGMPLRLFCSCIRNSPRYRREGLRWGHLKTTSGGRCPLPAPASHHTPDMPFQRYALCIHPRKRSLPARAGPDLRDVAIYVGMLISSASGLMIFHCV